MLGGRPPSLQGYLICEKIAGWLPGLRPHGEMSCGGAAAGQGVGLDRMGSCL